MKQKLSDLFKYPRNIVLIVFVLLFGGIGVSTLIGSHAATSCTTTISNNLTNTIDKANGGDTICLNAGNYGDINLSSINEPSDITIEPVDGTANTAVTLSSLTITSSSHLNFQSLTIGGVDLTGSSRNITIAHSIFNAGSYINLTSAIASGATAKPDVVIDSDTFDNINQPAAGYEGRVQFEGTGSDVQISNSHFSGGCADGIQTGANGGDIGPGNEFVNIIQNCSAHHVDPLQIYGGENLDIHGNYFHGNSTGIMMPDVGDNNITITDNVFDSPNYPPLTLGGTQNDTITHNTTNGTFRIYQGNEGQDSKNNTVTDNIVGGFTINSDGSSPFKTEDYNIVSGGSGAHDLKGNPTFVGGASPATLAGWQLAANSVGTNAASDGTNIGAPASTALTSTSTSSGSSSTTSSPASGTTPAPAPAASPAATSSGGLTFSPSSGNYTVGSTFTVTVQENSGTDSNGNPVPANTVDALVKFPSSLQFVSDTNVAPFNFNPNNTDTASSGSVTVTRSQLGTSSTGTQTVTVITFKVLAAGSATLSFNTGSDILSATVPPSNLLTSSPSATFTLTTPVTPPPPAATNLHSTGSTTTSISLAWTDTDTNVGGYEVFRGGTLVGTTSSTSYTDSKGLTAGTSYSYTVEAYDGSNTSNLSLPTASLVASTAPAQQVIAPPTNLTGKATSATAVSLSWTASTSTNVSHYYIVRSDANSPAATIATLGNVTSYTDSSALSNTAYTYSVMAGDSSGNFSKASNTVTVTTPNPPDTTPPSTPAGLTALAVSSTQINLSWGASTDNSGQVAGYYIYRSDKGTQPYATVTNGTTWGESSLTPSTTYSYTLKAFDAAGNLSSQAGPALATTLASSTGSTGAFLGTKTIGQNIDKNPSGVSEAFQTTATTGGTIAKIHIYLDSSSQSRRVVVGIYNNASGKPGTLLAQGTATRLKAGAWDTIPVPQAPVTAQQTYWVAILGSGQGTIAFRDTPAAQGTLDSVSAATNLTILPAQWTPGATYTNSPLSAYATN